MYAAVASAFASVRSQQIHALRAALSDNAPHARVSELIVALHRSKTTRKDWRRIVDDEISDLAAFLEGSKLRTPHESTHAVVAASGDAALHLPPPMLVACLFGDLEAAQLLSESAAYDQVNCTHTPHDISPLYVACGFGHLACVQWLVERGAEIDSADADDVTPLMVAVARQDAPIAQYLARIPRDSGTGAIGAVDHGKAALVAAVRLGHAALTEFLLDVCAVELDFPRTLGVTLLDEAGYFGHADVVRVMLAHGGELPIDSDDSDGDCSELLCDSALRGHWAMALYWMKRGANVNATSTYRTNSLIGDVSDEITILVELSPLMLAAARGHLATVTHLCEFGASVDAATDAGETALFFAAQYGHADVVKYLALTRGADTTRKTVYNATPATAGRDHSTVLEALAFIATQASGVDSSDDRETTDQAAGDDVDHQGHQERKGFIDVLLDMPS